MSNRELPMMPWFPQDFASATSAWTTVERALYRELLDAQWILGKLPTAPDRLARIARFDLETFKEAWQVVSTKFEKVSDCLLNIRLEEHRAVASAYVEQRRSAGRAGGLARAKRASSGASTPAQANVKHPSPSPSQDKNSVLSGEVKPSPSLPPRRSPSPERRTIRTSDPEEIERRRREAAAIAAALAAKATL